MDLTFLGIFQLLDFVGGVEDFGGLDVDGLSRSRLVVDEASDGAFVACLHRDDQPAVTDGELRFLVDPTGCLGITHDLADALLDACPLAADALADF